MIGFSLMVMTMVIGLLFLVGGLRFLRARDDQRLPAPDSTRFDRLESILTSLESRIDGLEDQQRFLERLLEQRPAPRTLESGLEHGPGTEGDTGAHDVDSVLFDRGEGEEREDR